MRFLAVFLLAAACGGSSKSANDFPLGAVVVDWPVGTTGGTVEVRSGTIIVWQSVDGLHHTVTSSANPPEFAEIDVPAGGISAEQKFIDTGYHPYFCKIHGEGVQSGTIRVVPDGG